MREEDKVCWSCANFEPYYRKGYSEFTKTKIGYCYCILGVVEKNSTCDRWAMKHYDKRTIVRALEGLEKGLNNIQAVKLILEENDSLHMLADKKAKKENDKD